MKYDIRSYLRINGQFVPIESHFSRLPDLDYLEGAISWRIGDCGLLSEEEWDLVDQLWAYLIDGALQFLQCGEYAGYFPDQPLAINFSRESRAMAKVQIGKRQQPVPARLLTASLADGGKAFFSRLSELYPTRKRTWDLYFEKAIRLKSLAK